MTDDVDKASSLEEQAHNRALTAHLRRIKEEPLVYGYCNDCGLEIAAERLAAVPDAVTCVDCQTERERLP